MAFLFSPKARPFADESLESYILRVVEENFFESFSELSLALQEALYELDFEAQGAFPADLGRLNIYHTKHNSHFRMRALVLTEGLLDLPRHSLQKLAILRAAKNDHGVTFLHRNGDDIPLRFFRTSIEETSIPICPDCLKEAPYIRQSWHIKWVNNCSQHNRKLIEYCPKCNAPINYIVNENLAYCTCGLDLSSISTNKTEPDNLYLEQELLSDKSLSQNVLFQCKNLSERFDALLWYQRYYETDSFDLEEVVQYFNKWPDSLYQELDEITNHAEMRTIDKFNKSKFSSLYRGIIGLLPCSRPIQPTQSPSHFIHIAVLNYLFSLVEKHPKSKRANVADMLVSVSEVAIILETSFEQVYRLYQDGVLTIAMRPKLKERIPPNIGAFYLRQVIEYKSSFGNINSRVYLSAW